MIRSELKYLLIILRSIYLNYRKLIYIYFLNYIYIKNNFIKNI